MIFVCKNIVSVREEQGKGRNCGEISAKSRKGKCLCPLGVTDVSCHLSDISVWWLSSSWHIRPFLLHFLRLPTSRSPWYLFLFLGTLWHTLCIQVSSRSPETICTYKVCDVLLCFFLVGPSAMTGLDGIGCILMTECLFMNYYQKSFQQL